MNSAVQKRYRSMLENYLRSQSDIMGIEKSHALSKELLAAGVPLEEIITFHKHILTELIPDLAQEVSASFDFLTEVLIGCEVEYNHLSTLREKQVELQAEICVAARMQQSLFPPVPLDIHGIELGCISKAANKMSGDYYHFFNDPRKFLSVAVADIIGKGIPAALCMSMIKYAIEGLPEKRMNPHMVLASINRVVEKNVDISMFITMIYGSYNLIEHTFTYATAGHEPGLFYCQKEDSFINLENRGLVLGLFKNTEYVDFMIQVEPGDMIILFSDGVTESKWANCYLDRKGLIHLIRKYMYLPAQQLVERIQQDIFEESGHQLRDDQTIIALRRMF